MSNAELSKPVLRRSELMLSSSYIEPEDENERAIAGIWRIVLNIDMVGLQDDFFEIGGDSLAAVMLAGQMECRFGGKFGPSAIVENSTVAAQAAYIKLRKNNTAGNKSPLPQNLTLFNADGSKAPLFIIHGGMGFTMYGINFLDSLGSDQPVGFLEAPGLDGKQNPLTRIEEFADVYLNAIRQVAPGGNWQIAANCGGSFIALEMCLLAEKQGERVTTVMLIDPPRLGWGIHSLNFRVLKKTVLVFCRSLLPGKATNFLARVGRSFGAGVIRGHDHEKDAAAYAASIDVRAGHQNKEEERIRHRLEADETSALPSRTAYNAEAMRRVRHALHKAIHAYALRRWNGTVHILACHARYTGISLYKRYFPNTRYRLVRHRHAVLFSEGLPDLLQFLKDGLSPNSGKPFLS